MPLQAVPGPQLDQVDVELYEKCSGKVLSTEFASKQNGMDVDITCRLAA